MGHWQSPKPLIDPVMTFHRYQQPFTVYVQVHCHSLERSQKASTLSQEYYLLWHLHSLLQQIMMLIGLVPLMIAPLPQLTSLFSVATQSHGVQKNELSLTPPLKQYRALAIACL